MKYLVFLLLLSFLSTPSLAQPSTDKPTQLDSPDFIFYEMHAGMFTSTFSCQDLPALVPILNSRDTNANWDLSLIKFTRDPQVAEVDSFMLPTGAPLATIPELLPANEVIRTTPTAWTARYQFFQFSRDSAFINVFANKLGITENNNGVDRKVITWDPPCQESQYPMTLGTSWKSTSNVTGDTVPSGHSRIHAVQAVVDQWGILTLPVNANYHQRALRVRRQTVETELSNGVVLRADTSIEYNYYTATLFAATIKTNTKNEILSGSYVLNVIKDDVAAPSSGIGSPLNLTLTTNPVQNGVTSLIYTLSQPGSVKLELYDALGRSIRSYSFGEKGSGRNIETIQTGTLPNGSYVIRLSAGDLSSLVKMVVSK